MDDYEQMDDNEILVFPTNFKFGSSVAAYQVEGDSGQRKADWDVFLKNNPHIVKPNEKGPEWWKEGVAEKDLTTMADLGLKIQRISLEWARIEPEKGFINHDAIKRYRQIIKKIFSLGMSPLVTLNHYVLPEWVAKEGSWESPNIAKYYHRYVELMVSEFPEVTHWLTLNEPNVTIIMGYATNYFPPQRNSLFAAIKASKNMIDAHKRAYHAIKNANPNAKVGVAYDFRWDRASNANDPFERLYTSMVNYFGELWYVDAMIGTSDFIGCNFYTGYFLNLNLLKFKLKFPSDKHRMAKTLIFGEEEQPDAYESDFGWPIVPDFLLNTLHILHHSYKQPILITENGVADRHDRHRAFFILTHLVAVWRALREGIPVRHYIHWSSVDNLEWAEGYTKKFGLIEVDPVTGKRTVRKSAHLLKEISLSGKIDINHLINTYIEGDEQKERANEVIRTLLRGELSRRIKK